MKWRLNSTDINTIRNGPRRCPRFRGVFYKNRQQPGMHTKRIPPKLQPASGKLGLTGTHSKTQLPLQGYGIVRSHTLDVVACNTHALNSDRPAISIRISPHWANWPSAGNCWVPEGLFRKVKWYCWNPLALIPLQGGIWP